MTKKEIELIEKLIDAKIEMNNAIEFKHIQEIQAEITWIEKELQKQ